MKLLALLFSITGLLHAAPRPADDIFNVWDGGWKGTLPGGWSISGSEVEENTKHMGGTLSVKNISVPLMEYFKPAPASATDRAVIVCPGGGYGMLAWDLEGREIAEWLAGQGIHAFVLKYRLPRPGDVRHAAALQDAQRALRVVRSLSYAKKIAHDKIGIMGFSAGGHLAALASTSHRKASYDSLDDIDKLSCRPDFSILIYTAYLLPEKASVGDALSAEFSPASDTPPCFIAHTMDDGIPVAGVFAWALALKEKKVPVEMHIYPDGGHGYGLRSHHSVKAWPEQLGAWLPRLSKGTAE